MSVLAEAERVRPGAGGVKVAHVETGSGRVEDADGDISSVGSGTVVDSGRDGEAGCFLAGCRGEEAAGRRASGDFEEPCGAAPERGRGEPSAVEAAARFCLEA